MIPVVGGMDTLDSSVVGVLEFCCCLAIGGKQKKKEKKEKIETLYSERGMECLCNARKLK